MNPSDLSLPLKFTGWRPNQLELAAKIAASSKYGYLLDSPTGTGKSLIAAAAQRLLKENAVYLCLTKNNTVWTNRGLKNIADIRVIDEVTVGPNRRERVYALGNRQYNGDIIKIRSAYYPSECLEVTPEHELLIVEGGWSKEDISSRSKVMRRADLVKPGDYMVYPASFGTPIHTSYKDEFIELCAWYVAEGWPDSKYRVLFSLGEHETENIRRLSELVKIISGQDAIIRKPSQSGIVVAMHANKEIAEFFVKNFRKGATNKMLPSWLFDIPSRQILIFLSTAMKGDGTSSISSGGVSKTFYYKTASRTLSLQLRLLAAQCGFLPGIAPHYSKNPHNRNDMRIGWLVSYRDSLVTNRGVRGYNDGSYMYLRVMKTQRVPYSGLVYDISVPSQQFCTVSATVHNCTTKQLQQQILNDFPYSKTLMGRSNYVCLKYPKLFPRISAEDCTHSEAHECDRRGGCPYMIAKMEAFRAPLAVLNTSYFLSEANYVGMFSEAKFLILDELDALEAQLMNFIQLSITKKQLDRIDIPPPKYKTKFEAWVEWANEMLRQLTPELDRLTMLTEKSGDWGGIDFSMLKRKNAISRLVSKLRFFVREVDKTWVPLFGQDEWVFKPVWVSKYSNGVLWKHAKKILGMSATILDPRQLSSNIGLIYGTERAYEYKALPSPFPKENRPIFYEPCANVVNKNMEVALPKLAIAVERILEKHPDEKILCHVVSYRIRDYLMKSIHSDRFVTHDTSTRASVLESFKASDKPKVLISPSMDRGVDLPGEECRVIIVAKVPYPDLGDPQINRRIHASKDGNNWYAHRTVSSIVQMSGRAVRSADDYASTYILDEQFSRLYREWDSMFPSWFKEAVIM